MLKPQPYYELYDVVQICEPNPSQLESGTRTKEYAGKLAEVVDIPYPGTYKVRVVGTNAYIRLNYTDIIPVYQQCTKVRFKDNLVVGEKYGGYEFTERMEPYKGLDLEIGQMNEYDGIVRYEVKHRALYCPGLATEEMLEIITDKIIEKTETDFLI